MGITFLIAAKSKYGNASIIVDNNDKLLCYGLESNSLFCDSTKYIIPSHITAILNYDKSYHNVVMYSSNPPSYASALAIMACSGIKSIYYFPKTEIEENVLDMIRSSYCDIEAFECNLNWIRDYFATINNK